MTYMVLFTLIVKNSLKLVLMLTLLFSVMSYADNEDVIEEQEVFLRNFIGRFKVELPEHGLFYLYWNCYGSRTSVIEFESPEELIFSDEIEGKMKQIWNSKASSRMVPDSSHIQIVLIKQNRLYSICSAAQVPLYTKEKEEKFSSHMQLRKLLLDFLEKRMNKKWEEILIPPPVDLWE